MVRTNPAFEEASRLQSDIQKRKTAYSKRRSAYETRKSKLRERGEVFKKKYKPYLLKERGKPITFQTKRGLSERPLKAKFKQYETTGGELKTEYGMVASEYSSLKSDEAALKAKIKDYNVAASKAKIYTTTTRTTTTPEEEKLISVTLGTQKPTGFIPIDYPFNPMVYTKEYQDKLKTRESVSMFSSFIRDFDPTIYSRMYPKPSGIIGQAGRVFEDITHVSSDVAKTILKPQEKLKGSSYAEIFLPDKVSTKMITTAFKVDPKTTSKVIDVSVDVGSYFVPYYGTAKFTTEGLGFVQTLTDPRKRELMTSQYPITTVAAGGLYTYFLGKGMLGKVKGVIPPKLTSKFDFIGGEGTIKTKGTVGFGTQYKSTTFVSESPSGRLFARTEGSIGKETFITRAFPKTTKVEVYTKKGRLKRDYSEKSDWDFLPTKSTSPTIISEEVVVANIPGQFQAASVARVSTFEASADIPGYTMRGLGIIRSGGQTRTTRYGLTEDYLITPTGRKAVREVIEPHYTMGGKSRTLKDSYEFEYTPTSISAKVVRQPRITWKEFSSQEFKGVMKTTVIKPDPKLFQQINYASFEDVKGVGTSIKKFVADVKYTSYYKFLSPKSPYLFASPVPVIIPKKMTKFEINIQPGSPSVQTIQFPKSIIRGVSASKTMLMTKSKLGLKQAQAFKWDFNVDTRQESKVDQLSKLKIIQIPKVRLINVIKPKVDITTQTSQTTQGGLMGMTSPKSSFRPERSPLYPKKPPTYFKGMFIIPPLKRSDLIKPTKKARKVKSRTFKYKPSLSGLTMKPTRTKAPKKFTGVEVRRVRL